MKIKKDKAVKVVFRLFEDQVIAIFPEELGTKDPETCSSYMIVGQHGTCIPEYIVANSKNPYKANRIKDIKVIKKELTNLGYKLHEVRNYCRGDYYLQVRKDKLNK